MNNKTIFITGGTGSFGTAFIKHILKNYTPKRIIVFSRDWQKQQVLRDQINNIFTSIPEIKWIIGDIRDLGRIKKVVNEYEPNYLIHAAAIKDIVACENNPTECLQTNIIGTQNIIDVCNNVERAVLISTDKAVLPINTYGTSKKMAEKLWFNAGLNFTICRYGNVIGSNGSVLPLFKKLILEGAESLPVTDERMSRFWYKMEDAINLVIKALKGTKALYIPEIPSIRIVDLCKALDMPYHITGIREGEKLHEYMIPPDDVTGSEGYSSGNNPHFLTVEEIRKSIE